MAAIITKTTIVQQLLSGKTSNPQKSSAQAYAPANIALAKYWGKRNSVLNLPVTSSLSIGLGNYGATTCVMQHPSHDCYVVNDQEQDITNTFSLRLTQFLNLFRPTKNFYFTVNTHSSVPIAAGVASSAAGFAALIQALDDFFSWHLSQQALSILARLGSGSAARSLWPGFVHWDAGVATDGMDSYGVPLTETWPELRVGLLLFTTAKKAVSSREAMQRTVDTSPFYACWPPQVAHTITALRCAITDKDFNSFGKISEENALAMHATLLTAQPAICYWLPATLATIQTLWELRKSGLPVYFTQDAGPNLKLLFLAEHTATLMKIFPELIVVDPFAYAAECVEKI